MDRERAERVRKAMEPPWDELREQRILSRVLAAKNAEVARKPWLVGRGRPFALIAAAAVLVLVTLGISRLWSSRTVSPHASQVDPTPGEPEGAQLTLVDGSVASMRGDAQVRVEVQSKENVELTQLGGQVHYDVTHDPSRPFRIHAGNVVVSVHGTRFLVTALADTVEVRVEQGVVSVDDGARTREVTAGETLIVPARLAVGNGADPAAPSSSASSNGNDGSAAALPLPTIAGSTGKTTADPSAAVPVTAAGLLARADEARAKGQNAEAATALRQMLAQFPADPHTPSAAFTLGRLERRLGNAAGAARAFARCRSAAPGGALAQDALAEEALAWSAAGQSKSASDAAKRYLAANPSGAYAARLSPLVVP